MDIDNSVIWHSLLSRIKEEHVKEVDMLFRLIRHLEAAALIYQGEIHNLKDEVNDLEDRLNELLFILKGRRKPKTA